MGKMMEQGPVLIITFQAQLVMLIRNTKGEVVEGDPVSANAAWGGGIVGPFSLWAGVYISVQGSWFVFSKNKV